MYNGNDHDGETNKTEKTPVDTKSKSRPSEPKKPVQSTAKPPRKVDE